MSASSPHKRFNSALFAKIPQKYDVIIVGAGLAGLAATLRLVQKGKRVILLEQNNQVGGYAVNFTRKHFRIEGALQSVTGCEPGGAFYEILKMIHLHDKIECIEIPQLKNQIDLETRTSFVYLDDYTNFITGMEFKYPSEIKNLKRFLRKGIKMANFLANWNISSKWEKFKLILKHFYQLPRLLFNFNKSAEDLLDNHFTNEELKRELYSYANFLGAEEEDLSAIVFFAAIFAKFTQDDYYLKGGSGHLTQLMAQEIERLGGTILLRTKVIKITEKQNSIVSIKIRLPKSKELTIDIKGMKILCCIDPNYLFNQLWEGHPVPARYFNSFQSRIRTESIFEVYLGLDLDLADLGFGEYCYEIRDKQGVKCLMFIYSNIDPSCAPPGCSNIEIIKFTDIDLFNLAVTADDGKRGKRYRQLKRDIQDMLIEIIADMVEMEDFEKHIVFKDAATPVTFQRYTNNSRGSFAGYVASFEQTIKNPISNKTPLSNLYLAGQWINLGGGFQLTIYGGIQAADIIIKALK